MTQGEPRHPAWDGDAMAETIGRELTRHDDDVWTHEPFLAWLADERRAQEERGVRARARPDALLQQGRSLRARVLARQAGVRLEEAPPPLVAPPHRGRAVSARAMDEAMAHGAVVRVEQAAAAGAGRELWDEPAEHWVALPPGVPCGRALALRISGESMAPLLHTGDTVLVELGPTLARGRVVVARHPEDGYVCKRVARVGRREVLLASVNREHGTITIPRDDRLIVGTVRMAWRG